MEDDISRAARRLIADHGDQAWFVATDLAIAAARMNNTADADICSRIARAIEEMTVRGHAARHSYPLPAARTGTRH